MMPITIETHVKALIFDFDGTLIDTMPLHYQAWKETVELFGAHFPEPLFYELAGAPSNKLVAILNNKYGYQLDAKRITDQKEKRFLEYYLPQAQPIVPMVTLVKQYHNRLPVAIGTGGILPIVQTGLKSIGLSDTFEVIVTADDVEQGKPAPDTFLKAADLLNVLPEHCHVFEDGDLGLEAAQRAGMTATDIRLLDLK
ncbi:MAG: beta-phosphoglucomutase family hydrolase [Chloroflexota bacterium]